MVSTVNALATYLPDLPSLDYIRTPIKRKIGQVSESVSRTARSVSQRVSESASQLKEKINNLNKQKPEQAYLVGNSREELSSLLPPESLLSLEKEERKIRLRDFLFPSTYLNKLFAQVLYQTDDNLSTFLKKSTQPTNLEEFKKAGAKIEQHFLKSPFDDKSSKYKIPLETWVIKHPSQKPDTETNVYLHGRTSNLNTFAERALNDFKTGKNVVLASYRGYSSNPGIPSMKGLVLDVKTVLDYLIDEQNLPSRHINIVAHSLGCAAALAGLEARSKAKNPKYHEQLEKMTKLEKNDPQGLLKLQQNSQAMFKILSSIKETYGHIQLLAPFSRASDLVKDKIKFLLLPRKILETFATKDSWDNVQRLINLSRVIENLHITHGSNDLVIDQKHSKYLHEMAQLCAIPSQIKLLKKKIMDL